MGLRVETLACQMAGGGDELIEPATLLKVDLAGVQEIVDLSKAGDSCQGIEESCKPIVYMGGLVCPRLKKWDARRWLSKPTKEMSGGRQKGVRFWREVVEAKNFRINRLEKELEQLKGNLYEERLKYQKQIEELLEEREGYRVEITRLLGQNNS